LTLLLEWQEGHTVVEPYSCKKPTSKKSTMFSFGSAIPTMSNLTLES